MSPPFAAGEDIADRRPCHNAPPSVNASRTLILPDGRRDATDVNLPQRLGPKTVWASSGWYLHEIGCLATSLLASVERCSRCWTQWLDDGWVWDAGWF